MTDKPNKKVMVSGCFDLLHSGHIAFLKSAAQYGHLTVCIGSDQTVYQLKNRLPINNEQERKYHLEALRDVAQVWIGSGSGYLDFLPEFMALKPDVFVVNEDGHSEEKQKLCEQNSVAYKVLSRVPHGNLPARSTTELRRQNTIPYRLDLAGGWLDQPFVSQFATGPVITICIEPDTDFNERSGMASSTRKAAIELWKYRIPEPNLEHTAKVLFAFENPPGTKEIAGSQDAIGIVYTGLNRLNYSHGYWPTDIEQVNDKDILSFIEQHVFLIPIGARKPGFRVLDKTNLNELDAMELSMASKSCWEAILNKDLPEFGKALTRSFNAQHSLFPYMADETIIEQIELLKPYILGYKLSGAGGGGYIVVVAEKSLEGSIPIRIRRKEGIC
jgi:cytidyltransferase-like protein